MRKLWIILGISISLVLPMYSQDLKPTEIEQAKLAKLKAQNETLQAQIQQINTQLQALSVLKQLTSEHQQLKFSELLGYSETVKQAHKEWGKSENIKFDPNSGEFGQFIKENKK